MDDSPLHPKWAVVPGEHGDFPPKWMSADGRTVYLVFSGEDAFGVRRANIRLTDRGRTLLKTSSQRARTTEPSCPSAQ